MTRERDGAGWSRQADGAAVTEVGGGSQPGSGPGVAVRLAVGVQGFGLASAVRVADRYITLAEQALGTAAPPTGPPQARTATPGARPAGIEAGAARLTENIEAGAARFTETYLSLLGQLADLVEPGDGPEQVVLPSVAPGGCSTAALWLHNSTDEPVTAALVAADLLSGTGARIPATAISALPEPETADPDGTHGTAVAADPDGTARPGDLRGAGAAGEVMPPVAVAAGGSRRIAVAVRIPAEQPPGTYHGVLLATGAVDCPIVVTLTVAAGGPP